MKWLVILLLGYGNPIQIDFDQRLNEIKTLADSSRYEEAIDQLYNLISEAKDDEAILGKAYIRLGTTLCLANKCQIGIKYYELSLELGHSLQNQDLIGRSLLGLGAAFQSLDSNEVAADYYKLSEPILTQSKDSGNLAGILSNIGLLLSESEKFPESEEYFLKSIEIQKRRKDWQGVAATYYNLGLSKSREGIPIEAVKYFESSVVVSKKQKLHTDLSKALRAISLEYYQLDDYKKAATYFHSYDSLGHNIFHDDYEDKILELETKFNTAEVERDNALKQAEIEEKRSQLAIQYFTLGFVIVISFAGYFFLDQRRKRIKSASERQINDLLQTQEMKTAYALLEGQDKERKRIAEELHDNLGSILVTLNMYSDSLLTKTKKEEIEDVAERISTTSQKANEEVRKISHSLDSGLLKHFGLKTAITQLMEAVEMSKDVEIELELDIDDTFNNNRGLQIYRVVQELVNNALKHANCSKIRIELSQIKKELSLIYEDNGIGFDATSVHKGMGLTNIRNRVKQLNGEFQLDSSPNKGTTFIIEIPAE